MPITTDGKMTAPLGVKAVANYFGVSTDVFSACTAGTINKWAKHKPIALASMGLADTPASLTADDKKAANYGLTYKSVTAADSSELPTAIAQVCGNDGLWTYTKPVAGKDWARLDDFLNPDGWADKTGYDPDAAAPCVSSDIEKTFPTAPTGTGIEVDFTERGATDYPGQIRFNELGIFAEALGQSYLCLLFKYGSVWYLVFSEDTVGNLVDWNSSDPFARLVLITDPLFTPFSSIPSGTERSFFGYLCLIDLNEAFPGGVPDYPGKCLALSEMDPSPAYTVYSLPFSDMKYSKGTFKVSQSGGVSALEYTYGISVGTSSTTITITVANNTTTVRTIYEMFVYIMSWDVYFDGGVDVNEKVNTEWIEEGVKYPEGIQADGMYGEGVYAAYGAAFSTAQTIAAGATKTFTVTFNSVTDAFNMPYNENAKVYGCARDSVSTTMNGRRTF